MSSLLSQVRKSIGILLLLAQGLALLPVQAKDPELSAPPPGFRIGMEMELKAPALANLTPFFDFKELQTTHGDTLEVPADFYDSYLQDSPRALELLPADLRAQLTEGLDLQKAALQESIPIVGSDGKPLAQRPSLILSPGSAQSSLSGAEAPKAGRLLRPTTPPKLSLEAHRSAPVPETFQTAGSLDVPRRVAWQTLYDRWKKLDPTVKARVVQWENLSPLKKAELAIQASNKIRPKENLPSEVKKLLDRLHWSRDLGALEFRHREELVVRNPEEFLADVRQLARLAGVERRIFNPEESQQRNSSFHYHTSVQGREFSPIADRLNDLQLLRRVNLGILNDLTGDGLFLYGDIHDKGLLSLKAKDRIEFRSHHQPLQEELAFNLKVLSLPEGEAIRLIDDEIRKNMTAYAEEKIAAHRPFLFEKLKDYLTPEQLQRNGKWIQLEQELREPRFSSSLWERIPALLETTPPSVQSKITSALKSQAQWPEEVWKKVPGLLASSDVMVQSAIASALRSQAQWPEEVWKKVPNLIVRSNLQIQDELAGALRAQARWPEVFWKNVPDLLASSDVKVLTVIEFALTSQARWPEVFWKKVPDLLASSGLPGQSIIVSSLRSQAQWPEFWKKVPDLLASSDSRVKWGIVSALKSQAQWPEEFWKKVPGLLASSDVKVQSAIASALRSQAQWPEEVWKKVPGLLASPDPQVQLQSASALKEKFQWPKELIQQMQKLLATMSPEVKSILDSHLENLNHHPILPEVNSSVATQNQDLAGARARIGILDPQCAGNILEVSE